MEFRQNNCGLTRRTFLAAAAGATVAVIGGCATTSPQLSPAAVHSIIDTHTHFYDPTRPQGVPWPAKDDAFLYRRVLPAEYEALARPLGIAGTVVVEASPWPEDNQFILDLAAKDSFIVGLCGNLMPGTPEFRKHFDRLKSNRLFRGVRLRDETWRSHVGDAAFLADLKRMADADLQVDINTGVDGLVDAAKLAGAVPSLRIVLDHCANTHIDGKAVSVAWLGAMSVLAKHSNVRAKLSGLVEGTGKTDGTAPTDAAFYKPMLDWMWQLFGEDRLIWGSNWPVSARFASLETTYRIVHDYVAGRAPPEAVRKVFGGNAMAAYKWIVRS
jgi:predicted TIM-barrel fold metal-dependent hydrolase